MDHIEKLLADIEALCEFQAEPTPVQATNEGRVQRYLTERYGPAWMTARVASYLLLEETIHVAVIAFPRGVSLRVVAEADGGELLERQGIERDDSAEPTHASSTTTGSAEQDCLSEIIPALIEADGILKDAKIKKAHKKYLRDQLVHAAKHLMSMEKGK